jgi:hypothetical protein
VRPGSYYVGFLSSLLPRLDSGRGTLAAGVLSAGASGGALAAALLQCSPSREQLADVQAWLELAADQHHAVQPGALCLPLFCALCLCPVSMSCALCLPLFAGGVDVLAAGRGVLSGAGAPADTCTRCWPAGWSASCPPTRTAAALAARTSRSPAGHTPHATRPAQRPGPTDARHPKHVTGLADVGEPVDELPAAPEPAPRQPLPHP